MDRDPDSRHDLILTIRLAHTPVSIRELRATNAERNVSADLWAELQHLEAERDAGGEVDNGAIDEARFVAEYADSYVREKDDEAKRDYHADYTALSQAGVVPVAARLESMFGENVRASSQGLNIIALRANREELEAAIAEGGIKRVSIDVEMAPMLDVSHQNIQADKVHDGSNNGLPADYTGAGVKVAIVDGGYDKDHPRLRELEEENEFDASEQGGVDVCGHSHGSLVAGVVFCQPGEDDVVGVAYDATPVIAKIYAYNWGGGGGCSLVAQTWSLDLDAFAWATDPEGPAVRILNFSQGFTEYGEPDEESDTKAITYTSLNVDWYTYTYDMCFTHSCGNTNLAPYLCPPSGSYNCLSVGGYDDDDTITRSDDVIGSFTSVGPSDDGRKKPDISAPGFSIYSTSGSGGFSTESGTSFAAPHIAGVCALLQEARPSITAQQTKAVLINSTVDIEGAGNGDWDDQGGWGAVDALNALLWRNYTYDDSITTSAGTQYYYFLGQSSVPVSVTCVWSREMESIDEAIDGSPGNINIYLDQRQGSSWVQVGSSASGDLQEDDTVFDNVERIYYDASLPAVFYRIRVVRDDNHTSYTQDFTIACRRPILQTWP